MNSIIFMTALVPTFGHKYLIDFAHNYIDNADKLYVIVSTRSNEPTTFEERIVGFPKHDNIIYCHHSDDDAPQNPNREIDFDNSGFWNYWKGVVESFVSEPIELVFASEPYGNDVAVSLNASFIPVNINRDIYRVKGTNVRQDLLHNQCKILPEFVHANKINIVFFGQECVGKSTMTNKFAEMYSGTSIPEYAREYLELMGAELTLEKMQDIANGQYCSEKTTKTTNTFFNFYDTDLLSTYGYFKLLSEVYGKKEYHDSMIKLKDAIKQNIIDGVNHKYIVLRDNIPFEKDDLRYGIDKRETDMQFWIDVLDEFGVDYHVVSEYCNGVNDVIMEVSSIINNVLSKHLSEIEKFERD